jgi:hypothetical protein
MTNHCTPEQSLALKEIGFDMPVENYIYTGDTGNNIDRYFHTLKADNHNADPLCVSLPTRSEVLQWAREKHGIDAWVESIYDFDNVKKYIFIIHKHDDSRIKKPTHPEAESALVNKIIEIIKERK